MKTMTDLSHIQYSDRLPYQVWVATIGSLPSGNDPAGRTINSDDHGKTNSPHGWVIGLKEPLASGKTIDIGDLQPLHWKTSQERADLRLWPYHY